MVFGQRIYTTQSEQQQKIFLIDKFTFLINQTSQQLKLHSDNETTVKIITEKIDKLNRGIKAIPFTNQTTM